MKVCIKQTVEVKVMGWSRETNGMCFSGECNINLQSKEESCDNQFISIYVCVLF